MSEIKSAVVEKTEHVLKINTGARFKSLTQERSGYCLNLDFGEICVEFYLSLDSLCDLMNAARGYLTQTSDHNLECQPIEVLRKQGAIFRILDNSTIHFVMTQIENKDVIVDFMWIMRDEVIIKNFLNSHSKYMAADLLYGLDSRWRGKCPDKASQFEIEQGKYALSQVIGTLYGCSDILLRHY